MLLTHPPYVTAQASSPVLLLTPEEVTATPAPSQLSARDVEALKQVLAWTWDFITRPNPGMKRAGAVCPFAKPAIQQGTLYLTVCPLEQSDPAAEIAEKMQVYRDVFLSLPCPTPDLEKLRCLMIVFPDMSDECAEALMEPLHKTLKTELLQDDIMLGQFYASCPMAATTNPFFFPLQSPVPMLVMRTFIESDWRFLAGRADWEARFLEKFSKPTASSITPTKV